MSEYIVARRGKALLIFETKDGVARTYTSLENAEEVARQLTEQTVARWNVYRVEMASMSMVISKRFSLEKDEEDEE